MVSSCLSGAESPPPFYITTPIYYVNDVPHIGHAYTSVAADVLARFARLEGRKVLFLTGTDEHGQKVAKAAEAKGMMPQAFVDKVSQNFWDMGKHLHLTNDDFIRTTEPRHQKAAQAFWTTIQEKGFIYEGTYAGWYALRDEAYYQESELVDGKAPTGAEVQWMEEKSYFFKLSAFQDPLLSFYASHPEAIGPESRRNEVLSFIAQGLKDLCISRSAFRWGVPVPGDSTHVMYVWIEALVNYLSALGYPHLDTPAQNFWNHSLHLVGKDIVRFHSVYWPALLMAAGLTPPARVFVHGWWTHEGQKMSKSLGNTVDPLALIKTYGVDAVRYFLIREVPFGSDGDFSEKALINRTNSDLANAYGNLVQRVLSFVFKNCGGRVPSFQTLTSEDQELLDCVTQAFSQIQKHKEAQALHKIGETLWNAIDLANGYVDSQGPWNLKKTNGARMETVLYVLMESIRRLALLTQPLVPLGSEKILDQLGIAKDARTFKAFTQERLVPGTVLPPPEPVFPRIQKP